MYTSFRLYLYDKTLLFSFIALLVFGLVMVLSTSIVVSTHKYHTAFHYLIRQIIFVIIGLFSVLVVLRIKIDIWKKWRFQLLLTAVFLLFIVLLPGMGKSVNGGMRWISLGLFNLQVSEYAKLCVIVYLSGYLSDHIDCNSSIISFLKPLLILSIIAMLLLQEPDFGATVVVFATALSMMFMSGMRLLPFFCLFIIFLIIITLLAVNSPYRMQRLVSFIHPWENRYNSGYQLTQSLIAFGRGGWFGVGLGGSIQKLFYLPEAHTDFLCAVLVEELGLFGAFLMFVLYILLITRGLLIARKAHLNAKIFSAMMAYGLSFWLSFQIVINIGVNIGLLPTKGLTLPLMSYGGSSIIINCLVVALLLRIDHELRWSNLSTNINSNIIKI